MRRRCEYHLDETRRCVREAGHVGVCEHDDRFASREVSAYAPLDPCPTFPGMDAAVVEAVNAHYIGAWKCVREDAAVRVGPPQRVYEVDGVPVNVTAFVAWLRDRGVVATRATVARATLLLAGRLYARATRDGVGTGHSPVTDDPRVLDLVEQVA